MAAYGSIISLFLSNPVHEAISPFFETFPDDKKTTFGGGGGSIKKREQNPLVRPVQLTKETFCESLGYNVIFVGYWWLVKI